MEKREIDNGYYCFKLSDLIKEKNISINKLGRDTDTDYKVIRRLMDGNLTKIDIVVLGRICNYLNCGITDIVEYKKIG